MLQNKHNLKHVIPLSVYIWDFSYRLLHSYCQDAVSSLKWEPTGHLLLCLGRSEVVKILGRSSGIWVTLHTLIHNSTVNVAEWCPLAGRAPDPRLMLAA